MRLSFSLRNQLLQTAWDSTSLGAFKTCPRYYYYSIVIGKVFHAESVHLKFGTVYHHAQQEFHRCIAEGATQKVAVRSAVRVALNETRGWQPEHKYKTRYNLIRSLVWHFDQFGAEDPIQTIRLSNGKPATELSWRFDFGISTISTGEPIQLCGHLDRLGMFHDKPWIIDYKTTVSYLGSDFFQRYSPDNQFSTYTLAGKVVFGLDVEGVIVDAAQVLVEGTRFQRGFAHRTPAQLDEWRSDTEWWLRLAEQCAIEGYWPMNDKSCNMYGGCPYRQLCGKDPGERPLWINAVYEDRLWDPLQVRGEL